ncbi:MAG: ABC transporter permease [Chloroflexi bacterium]|nr:ABC transporter permease [Chloroflexota bacterium]
MREYIIRRLLLVIPIMIGVSFVTYATFSIIPGDAAVLVCGFGCNDEVLAALRADFGLDDPFWVQYGNWLWNAVQLDFGESFVYRGQTVTGELEIRLPITLQLMVMAMFMSLVLGIAPGVFSAIRPGTVGDWVARFVSVLGLSVPNFYLAILVIAFGAAWFGWSPPQFGTSGTVLIYEDPIKSLEIFFFPSLVLAVGIAAVIMRLTRSSMLEVLRNDYVRTAWSKGLRERAVVWRHALKNAMIPVLTIIGLQVGGLIGGAVIIERIFALHGVGEYLLEAILRRDLLVVQSVVLIFAIAYVVINLAIDIAYAWLDPRIHYG